MPKRNIISMCTGIVVCVAVFSFAVPAVAGHHEEADDHEMALVKEALKAAPPELAKGATVMDWGMKVLKQGDNGWTCFPTNPHLKGTAPMCHDAVWMEWADAYLNKKDYAGGKFGMSYMLAGDEGASNIDPFAEGPTEDNQWVVEGPHLMILVADKAQLEGMSTDPWNGGPYVMWKDTPYVHIMVPVGGK
jgi:hypothetical protein